MATSWTDNAGATWVIQGPPVPNPAGPGMVVPVAKVVDRGAGYYRPAGTLRGTVTFLAADPGTGWDLCTVSVVTPST